MRCLLTAVSIVLLCFVPVDLGARQTVPRSSRNANYVLTAALDPLARTIDGRGRLEWRNTTAAATSELRFHLYWNAWRDGASTWMRERALAGDGSAALRHDADRSAIDLTSLRLISEAGATDLLPGARWIAPDDGNGDDRTVLSVPLTASIAPGASVHLEFSWTAKVPRTFDRTGVLGQYFFIAQWFPKIGVLQDDGWRAAQFHEHTEFFADFGTYDVSLTVPTGWTVGATGREVSRAVLDGGTTTHRYVEDDVHDFAWTTSPDFIERRDRVETPGKPPVDLRLLLQPEHATEADRYLTAAREALKHWGERLGPYPWPQLTIVDPVTVTNPRVQGGTTSGMEYPTLITGETRWSTRWSDDLLETTIVHEVGHQYFQSAVASNETDHAWLDEGLTTFLTGQIVETAFPHRFVAVDRYLGGLITWQHPSVRWSRLHQGYALDAYRDSPGWDAATVPTWRQSPQTSAVTTYARVPLALETLERLLGADVMAAAFSTFFAHGRFGHPTPEDFFSIVNTAAGRDMAWFFDATLRRPDLFDYAVDDVTSTTSALGTRRSTVVVRRLASGVFPIDVRVTFADGEVALERWDGQRAWQLFTYERDAAITRVEIDPDRILVLDVYRTNNSWTSAPLGAQAADKWTMRWLAWMQHTLMTYAFFA